MNKKIAIIISPNYQDYAKKYLAECLAGLRKQDYAGEVKIFIADNESAEASYEYVKKILDGEDSEGKIPLAPFVKGGKYEILRNKNNDGFAKGNNDCMRSALKQGFDYIVLFNMDTVAEPDCASKMVAAAEPEFVGAVEARLMLYGDKNKINSLGNVTHFLGFGYASGYGEEYREEMAKEICYPSGAAVLFKAEVLEKVGLFDETMWMYNEDQDLGWRLWLAGFKCVLAADAVVYHKYEFSRSVKKYYFLDRNRIIAILKNYRLATLVMIFPAFLVMEIGLLFFAARGGWFKEKIKVYGYFLNLNNWRYLLAERKKIQNARTVPDRNIIKLFSSRIWHQELDGPALRLGNVVFNVYWQIVQRIIFW